MTTETTVLNRMISDAASEVKRAQYDLNCCVIRAEALLSTIKHNTKRNGHPFRPTLDEFQRMARHIDEYTIKLVAEERKVAEIESALKECNLVEDAPDMAPKGN